MPKDTDRKARGRRVKIVIGSAAAIVSFAVGMFWSGAIPIEGNPFIGDPASPASVDSGDATAATAPVIDTALITLDRIIVNIEGTNVSGTPRPRVLSTRLSIVYDQAYDEANEDKTRVDEDGRELSGLAAEEPFIRDAFIRYLREVHERDISGSAGMREMKAELRKRARAAIGSDAVKDVLISDLVLQ